MIRTRLIPALAAALAFLLVWAMPAAAQNKPFYGVAQQGALTALLPGDFQRMQSGRVGTMRFLVNWPALPRYSNGAINWTPIDRAVGGAASRGVRSLPFIYQQNPPISKEARNAYAGFTFQMARRYAPGGPFWTRRYERFHSNRRLPIVAWQILNEQNATSHWGAKPSPRAYARVLRAAANAIRSRHRGAEIVLGGMFGTPSSAGSITSWKYLDRLYRLKGIKVKRFFNTVAVHPYAPRGLNQVREQMTRVRQVMRRHNHGRAGTRVTEFGWGSASPSKKCASCKGPRGQRKLLLRSFELFSNHRNRRGGWNIRGINWFSWQDGSGCPFCSSSGLFSGPPNDRKPKPAWRAFKRSTK